MNIYVNIVAEVHVNYWPFAVFRICIQWPPGSDSLPVLKIRIRVLKKNMIFCEYKRKEVTWKKLFQLAPFGIKLRYRYCSFFFTFLNLNYLKFHADEENAKIHEFRMSLGKVSPLTWHKATICIRYCIPGLVRGWVGSAPPPPGSGSGPGPRLGNIYQDEGNKIQYVLKRQFVRLRFLFDEITEV